MRISRQSPLGKPSVIVFHGVYKTLILNELDNISVAVSVDASWHLCPVPILMTEEKILELKGEAILELIFTDPGAKPDLEAWCKATGNILLGFKQEKPKYFAYLKKKKD